MEGLRAWAFAVCTAAVAGSLVRMITPQGTLQKTMNLTVSLFFLCVLLSPVLTGALSGEFMLLPSVEHETTSNTQALEQQMQQQVEQNFRASVENLVRQVLQGEGAEPLEIFININTNGQGGISITETRVTLSEANRPKGAELAKLIEEQTGQKPVLTFVLDEKAAEQNAAGG